MLLQRDTERKNQDSVTLTRCHKKRLWRHRVRRGNRQN